MDNVLQTLREKEIKKKSDNMMDDIIEMQIVRGLFLQLEYPYIIVVFNSRILQMARENLFDNMIGL